ncbi:MAG: tRNA (adenine(37)-N6)-methyltransferase [Candidatus Celerinatantimonas neptuna]|nr:MAG: tRNA (adenine(37)-N6)-methyltransferase [Candidatus Celerinatantimonas neptuna]
MKHTIEPIGYIESPYLEKFAVPRQPGIIPSAQTRLRLSPPFNAREIFDGIEQFSHFWIIFGFHQNWHSGWQNKVRPPRLGGNKRIGVFASRSTFRPNGLGLSVLPFKEVIFLDNNPCLVFQGGDLVNGTPVYDIKPYLSYADAIDSASSGYAPSMPEDSLNIRWNEQARHQLCACGLSTHEVSLIEQVLSQDPRPSYRKHKQDDRQYGVKLIRFNILFTIKENQCTITSLTQL